MRERQGIPDIVSGEVETIGEFPNASISYSRDSISGLYTALALSLWDEDPSDFIMIFDWDTFEFLDFQGDDTLIGWHPDLERFLIAEQGSDGSYHFRLIP